MFLLENWVGKPEYNEFSLYVHPFLKEDLKNALMFLFSRLDNKVLNLVRDFFDQLDEVQQEIIGKFGFEKKALISIMRAKDAPGRELGRGAWVAIERHGRSLMLRANSIQFVIYWAPCQDFMKLYCHLFHALVHVYVELVQILEDEENGILRSSVNGFSDYRLIQHKQLITQASYELVGCQCHLSTKVTPMRFISCTFRLPWVFLPPVVCKQSLALRRTFS